jgi:hypothetical protein
MRVIAIILMTVFSVTVIAQRSSVEKFVNKHSKKDGFSVQVIDVGSEEFAAQFKIEGDEASQALEQLEVIKILSSDSTATAEDRDAFCSKALEVLDDEDYAELLVVHADDGEEVGMFANQMENGLIREIILMVNEEDETMMIYVKGEMDMSSLFSKKLIESVMGDKKAAECE